MTFTHLLTGPRPEMPRISSNVLDCALYLYQSKEDARMGGTLGGSGFLFPLSYADTCRVKGIHVYAVTNAHALRNTPCPVIRLRRHDGEKVIIDPGDAGNTWIRHPAGDDLAACLLSLDDVGAFRLHTPVWHLRPERNRPQVDEMGEILGRDVVMIGRFIGHDGKETNVPSLRFGNVAALPVEPITDPDSGLEHDSFLVEMRSLPGFSGSPVFVLPDMWRQMQVDPVMKKLNEWGLSRQAPYYSNPIQSIRDMTLLGVDWCHLDRKLRLVDKYKEPYEDELYVLSNSGMAGVVPWWKLWELFDDSDMKAARKKIEDEAEKAARESSVSLD